MTSNRLVTLLRELTANQYSDNVLLMWLSNCENTVLTDVLLASPEDCVELTELSDEKLLVPHPWDKLYLPYMQAQVAHANGEYDHYANYIALYNAYLEEYARHILETVQPAGGEAVTHGYYLSAYAIAVEHGYKGTVEQWLESLRGQKGDGGKDAYTIAVENGFNGTVEQWLASMKGDAATVEIVGATALAAVDAPTVTEVEGSTPAERRYKLGIPAGARGIPGEAGRLAIVGADALAPGAAPTVTEMADSTAQYRLYKLGIPQGQKGNKGDKGDTGGTSLPIARANVPAGTDDVYTATGDLLPVVSVANNPEQISAVGKGLQIVFIPMIANKTESPKLRLNGGEAIPIRMRWYTNKGTNESAPEATTNVEVGSLMRGVPYTLTFCGKYWLVDSQITSPSFDNTTRGTLQSVANGFIGASGGNNFAVPINYQNGVIRNAMISTTEEEKESNSINLVSEGKASEMIRKDVTAEWEAFINNYPGVAPEDFAVTLGAGRYFFGDVETFRAYATVVEWSFPAGETKLTFLTTLYDEDIHHMQIFANGTLIYETDLDAVRKSSNTWLYQSGTAERVITSGKYPPPTSSDNGMYLGCKNGAATWLPVEASGGGKEWRLINKFTIETEDLVKIYFDKDLDGNPFELSEVLIFGDGRNATTNSGSTGVSVFFRFGDGSVGAGSQQYVYPIRLNSGDLSFQRGFMSFVQIITDTTAIGFAGALVNSASTSGGNLKVTISDIGACDAIREIAIFPGNNSTVLYGVGTIVSVWGR